MKRIFKYTLGPAGRQTLDIPTGFRVRHVGPQRHVGYRRGGIQLWAEVDPDAPTVAATFEIVGTGQSTPGTGIYCGTAVMGDGFVWHVYLIGTAP